MSARCSSFQLHTWSWSTKKEVLRLGVLPFFQCSPSGTFPTTRLGKALAFPNAVSFWTPFGVTFKKSSLWVSIRIWNWGESVRAFVVEWNDLPGMWGRCLINRHSHLLYLCYSLALLPTSFGNVDSDNCSTLSTYKRNWETLSQVVTGWY